MNDQILGLYRISQGHGSAHRVHYYAAANAEQASKAFCSVFREESEQGFEIEKHGEIVVVRNGQQES